MEKNNKTTIKPKTQPEEKIEKKPETTAKENLEPNAKAIKADFQHRGNTAKAPWASHQRRASSGAGRGPRGSEAGSEFEEKVIEVDRISRTVAGGRRIRFRVLIAIGNHNGKIGIGVDKGPEVVTAINKAKNYAKKHMISVPIVNETIPYPITKQFGSAKILFKPAPKGTSIIAGGAVRQIIELSGIKNIVCKMLGSANKINNAKATLLALETLQEYKNSNK